MNDPYEELAALAEVELGLAREGALDALAATLPAAAPATARTALRRAAALQAMTTEALRARLDGVRDALTAIDHGQRALSGYARPSGAPSRVDCAG
jgi:hypothetical protein